MVQLSHETGENHPKVLTLAEAEASIIAEFDCVTKIEEVPLTQATGRALAEPVISDVCIPPFDNSAVDGYAFRHADLSEDGPTTFEIDGREAAGNPGGKALSANRAVQIFTGALLPDGADTIAMQEDCVLTDGKVTIPQGLQLGDNKRVSGEDVALNQSLFDAGHKIRPTDVALLGALGRAEVSVHAPLRVALFSTGDEVVEPGQPLQPGQLYDANRFMLGAMLEKLGVAWTDCGILPDSVEKVTESLAKAAADHDAVITSAGVSMGEEDHVKTAIESLGALRFWKVAIKPGRPVVLGTIAGKPLIGLPGNPGAALVTFALVARRVLERLAGFASKPLPRFSAISAFDYKKKPGRREFQRANLIRNGETLSVLRHPKPGAGTITSMTESDALIELPEDDTLLRKGDIVQVIPMDCLYD